MQLAASLDLHESVGLHTLYPVVFYETITQNMVHCIDAVTGPMTRAKLVLKKMMQTPEAASCEPKPSSPRHSRRFVSPNKFFWEMLAKSGHEVRSVRQQLVQDQVLVEVLRSDSARLLVLLGGERHRDLRQRRSIDLNHRVSQPGTWKRGSAR